MVSYLVEEGKAVVDEERRGAGEELRREVQASSLKWY
jgi:hypothetical protein